MRSAILALVVFLFLGCGSGSGGANAGFSEVNIQGEGNSVTINNSEQQASAGGDPISELSDLVDSVSDDTGRSQACRECVETIDEELECDCLTELACTIDDLGADGIDDLTECTVVEEEEEI